MGLSNNASFHDDVCGFARQETDAHDLGLRIRAYVGEHFKPGQVDDLSLVDWDAIGAFLGCKRRTSPSAVIARGPRSPERMSAQGRSQDSSFPREQDLSREQDSSPSQDAPSRGASGVSEPRRLPQEPPPVTLVIGAGVLWDLAERPPGQPPKCALVTS